MRSTENNYDTSFNGDVFDVASLALYGCHAIPVRVKILLDRLFASLAPDGVATVLERLGWSPEEYARGYIVQDRQGHVIERWTMCTKEEELLIIEQFARFEETKILSQKLLHAPAKHEEVKKSSEKEQSLKPFSQEVPINPYHLMQPPEFFQRHFNPFPGFHLPNLPLSPPLSGQIPVPFQRMHMPQFDVPKQAVTVTSTGQSGHPQMPEQNGSGSSAQEKKGKENPSGPQTPSESDIDLESDYEADSSALNLTKCKQEDGKESRKIDQTDSQNSVQRQPWNPLNSLGTQLINPSTGKKRVQCNVCFKTFCDKGALKIHFSAVHLREMHKCTVDGCNMMFSSRRSRNRHSANPNPKLHSPHLRRKISPHDGRTCQTLPIVMGQNSMSPPFPLSSLSQGFHPAILQSVQRFESTHLSSSSGRISPRRENENSSDNDVDDLDDQMSDGLSDGEDEASADNQSVNDGQSSSRVARKRKSQNPTRLMQVERFEKCDYSSDSDRETKKIDKNKPLDLRDTLEKKIKSETVIEENDPQPDNPLRHLENLSQGRIDELMSRGVMGTMNNYQAFPLGLLAAAAMNDENKRLQIAEDSSKNEEDDHADSNRSSPDSEGNSECSSLGSSFLGVEVPINRENPRQCIACGKMFQNHFGVKTHYQNVHLKLMHKCTVDGCQAAFPSKRSRDRHSANLNLHRKLLSTSSGLALEAPEKMELQLLPEQMQATAFANGAALRDEILARLYGDPSSMMQHLNPFLPNLHQGMPHTLLLHPYSDMSHLHPFLNNNTKNESKFELDEDLIGEDDFECKLCKKMCPNKSSLYGHYERRHGSELLRCSFTGCQKLFLTQEKWLLHIKNPQSHSALELKTAEPFNLNQNVTSSSVC
ncbi:zinc finger protein basonuclin-1-like isoform X2 [Artemia franciscana]|nr:hypothetical protein QYM36_006799 [Artemia franciscana]